MPDINHAGHADIPRHGKLGDGVGGANAYIPLRAADAHVLDIIDREGKRAVLIGIHLAKSDGQRHPGQQKCQGERVCVRQRAGLPCGIVGEAMRRSSSASRVSTSLNRTPSMHIPAGVCVVPLGQRAQD